METLQTGRRWTPSNTPVFTPTFTAKPSNPAFTSASFIYDGDSKRVKSILNMGTGTNTTYFVGGHYEVTNGTVTKYYYAGSQRIAMRTNGTLNYLLGDHLGSTSLVTDAAGAVVSEMRYKAWGETRYASGTTPTKYQYTGQYSYAADFGLHFYNARWYDGSLSRFAQADTIIPSAGNSKSWDRYAYATNNPLRYTDPSGHVPCFRAPGRRCLPEITSRQQPSVTPTPTLQSVATRTTMAVHCGIGSGGISAPGAGCGPGGSQASNHMTIWGGEYFDDYGFDFDYQYHPYPGYAPRGYAADDTGKALQSTNSFSATMGLPSVINVGYSAGAEAAVFATEQRGEHGLSTAALVLIGPTYSTESIAVDYNGVSVNVDALVERIANLSAHTPVLIVDDTGQYKALFETRYPNANVTFVDPLNPDHAAIDDTLDILEQTANWLASVGVR